MAHDRTLIGGEQSVLVFRPHWKTVVGPSLRLALVVAAAVAFAVLVPFGSAATIGRGAIAGVALVAAFVCFGIPLLRWRATTYQLTTRRLRMREGILNRDGRDIPLSRINDVSFSRGIVDRMFGCGKLVVESAGEHGQLMLTEIPHVERVQGALYELIEHEQERMAAAPGES